MSVILKSNVPYTGTKKLRNATTMSMTSQQYFDAYHARVLADGGVIIDETKTKATIDFLFANDLIGRTNVLVSAFYGIRKDANNNVDKLYSISGKDVVSNIYGSGELPKFNAAENLIDVVATTANNYNGNIFTTEDKVRVSAKGTIGFIVVAKMDKVDVAQPSFVNYSDLGEQGDSFAMGNLILSSNKVLIQNPIVNNVQTTAPYVVGSNQPILQIWDVSRRSSKLYVNSVQTYSATMDLEPKIPLANKYLSVGGSAFGSGKSFSHHDWQSVWALFDFTEAEGVMASDFLKTL